MVNKDESKKIKNKGDELAPIFNEEEYCSFEDVVTQDGRVVKAKQYNKEFRKKGTIMRGKLRAAEALGISLKHLEEVAKVLNYKKIDGIFINDLIGRYGFYNGEVKSRADIARSYNLDISIVQNAIDKLIDMVRFKDVSTKYMEYLESFKKVKDKEFHSDITGTNE